MQRGGWGEGGGCIHAGIVTARTASPLCIYSCSADYDLGMRALFTLISSLRHLLMGCILLGILATGVLAATPGRFSESVL